MGCWLVYVEIAVLDWNIDESQWKQEYFNKHIMYLNWMQITSLYYLVVIKVYLIMDSVLLKRTMM